MIGTVDGILDAHGSRDELRVDLFPQREHCGFRLRAGRPIPFGATHVPGGVNFSIFSSEATTATLVLFEKGAIEPIVEIPFPPEYRVGNVFAMVVFGLDPERTEYSIRMDGPWVPGEGRLFRHADLLLDPYAQAVSGRERWGQQPDWNKACQFRGCLVPSDFDWEDDQPLGTPLADLVIYEMHVRGFSQHPSSGVNHPGTFAAIREKIPYLKSLGVNAVELMPIFEFDEWDNAHVGPETGRRLFNYWGYSSVGFFAPKAGYAATGHLGMQVDELKALVRDLHQNGIEVLLDVVYNHTAEGNEDGPTISFRGFDNRTYYMLTPNGEYFNFSGCGNTLNCNNPVVRAFVLDSLRYWASEFHIDGFRFDLASILGRDPLGVPLSNPPLLESLAFDPVLARCKLIAEAWDAGGLYQVGSFPAYGRWAEWNGKYRDTVRRFLKGDAGQVGDMARRVLGSPDLYASLARGAAASINFITAHDGFTARDLVSYNGKHNEANGENNRDGTNDNFSWNCGAEGDTSDPEVLALRMRQMKNGFALLLCSQGAPMFSMGDEVGRTQHGNNNAYCHDSELTWFDWGLLHSYSELLHFASNVIAFRRRHPVLRQAEHLRSDLPREGGIPAISWHGTSPWQPDWSFESRRLAFMLAGAYAPNGGDDNVYVAANMHWDAAWFALPQIKAVWHVFANTGAAPPDDVFDPGAEQRLPDQQGILVGPRSVVILISH